MSVTLVTQALTSRCASRPSPWRSITQNYKGCFSYKSFRCNLTMTEWRVSAMRTLVYKMTHIGDPDPATGLWGETGCMGQVRSYQFDAVIGIGGTSAIDGIAGKIVWIGTGPHKN